MSAPMTEQEARASCERLAREHTDRETHQFLPREVEGGWAVVKVAIPPPLDNLTGETRADERPETGDDPRTAQVRNTGPHIGG